MAGDIAEVVAKMRAFWDFANAENYIRVHLSKVESDLLCDAAEECARLREENRKLAYWFSIHSEVVPSLERERDEARAELEQYKAQIALEVEAKHEARAECERLRGELRLHYRLEDLVRANCVTDRRFEVLDEIAQLRARREG